MFYLRLSTVCFICTMTIACGSRGNYVTEKRAVPSFEAIEISGAVQLEVEVGPRVSVSVEGDDQVLGRLQTDVRDGKLWIHSEIPYLPKADLKVRVTTPELNYLGVSTSGTIDTRLFGAPLKKLEVSVTGLGKLQLEGVDAKDLKVRVRGAGNITIRGQTDFLEYTMTGAGAGKMEQLCAREAKVIVNGAGKATVNAVEKLDATLRGIGSIQYFNEPKVTKHISKVGRLRHLSSPKDEAAQCPAI